MDSNDRSYIRTAADQLFLDEGGRWAPEHGEAVIRFIERYYRPQFIEGKLRLLEWQRATIRQLYNWRLPNGNRRWRKAIISCAKKNGKLILTSGILAYELWASKTVSPWIVACSTTKENAKQTFGELHNTCKPATNPRLAKISKPLDSQRIIRVKSRNATFQSISNEAGNAEGLNLSLALADEIHAWESDKLYRAIEYATIARPDGLLLITSTAGHDQSHFWHDLWVKAENVLKGVDLDTSTYAELHTIPPDRDLENDPACWDLANPSLGVAFSGADYRRDLLAAKGNHADWLSFQRYRANRWVQGDKAWLDLVKWDACLKDPPELAGRPLWIGLDLSQTTDISAVACCWALGENRFHIRAHGFVCQEGVKKRESTNLPKYQQYAAAGALTITEGDVAEYPRIKEHVLDIAKRHNVKEVIVDAYNAIELSLEFQSEGLTVYRFPQNYRHYTAPCKAFEIAIAEQRISHEGNPLLRWCAQNVCLDVDPDGNCKPSRRKSTDKIDLMIAGLMAFARANESSATPEFMPSVYDDLPGICVC